MFTPHTPQDVEAMLKVIGLSKLEDLFQEIPEQYRFPELNLPPALTEMEVNQDLESIARANGNTSELISFLGAGAYDHYILAAVDMLLRRGEIGRAHV